MSSCPTSYPLSTVLVLLFCFIFIVISVGLTGRTLYLFNTLTSKEEGGEQSSFCKKVCGIDEKEPPTGGTGTSAISSRARSLADLEQASTNREIDSFKEYGKISDFVNSQSSLDYEEYKNFLIFSNFTDPKLYSEKLYNALFHLKPSLKKSDFFRLFSAMP
jgi:hypothetical protein